MATAWATIDLDAVAANIAALREVAAPAALCAVVKADAYGHGAAPVARAAVAAGASWLAVAQVGEGEALRAAGLDAPILVLSEPEPGHLERAIDAGLRVTLFTAAGIEAAAAVTGVRGATLSVHLKVDTGMHRLGAHPGQACELAQQVIGAVGLELEAVWTHLAVADEPDHPFTALQLERYRSVLAHLGGLGIVPPMRHVANSAGAIAHPDARFDLVRCGIATYGIAPSPELAGRIDLKPVMSLSTRVVQVKRVPAGDALSYGLHHRFEVDSNVATISIGYADGVRRDLHRLGGEVLVGGKRCRIVGTVTMDLIMVDCGQFEPCVGDEAVLIGQQGSEVITAEELGHQLGTIPYEVVCGIGPRVERRWSSR